MQRSDVNKLQRLVAEFTANLLSRTAYKERLLTEQFNFRIKFGIWPCSNWKSSVLKCRSLEHKELFVTEFSAFLDYLSKFSRNHQLYCDSWTGR
jgi:hypothetical protein